MTAAATFDMPTLTPNSKQRSAPAGLERVVLTGFMGSGKTTVGRLLAEELGWKFCDLDAEVERREGRSVPEIFAAEGEAHFRHLESAALAVLLGQRRVVIALGGGAPEELGNRLLLEQTPRTAVVYLAAPLEVLMERCRVQAVDPGSVFRPVLAEAAVRFARRKPLYERMAGHCVETGGVAAEVAVGMVLRVLGSSDRFPGE